LGKEVEGKEEEEEGEEEKAREDDEIREGRHGRCTFFGGMLAP
jgi:hypothetical protein